ncbi:right-handed parallel beta-helix repeat-containing protein [Halobacteria archaeon AArc-m2/3/4]|uniref:Right-handed parallel beta-helix repeat-containing protein n=1 Tax=Natronoglomus mannanivorans TaxID=2979990 RepID=A0ABT2QG19_9EURY|nr:right-handed parallel beta-helix repeat-containing protein [Halobacteria archaeon AArc-m2/3/4]
MTASDSRSRRERNREADDSSGFTRRRALAVLGSGLVAGHVATTASADGHEADVWEESGTWHAEAHGSQVHSGGDMFAAIQSAIDGLSSGRSSKETVIVWDGGSADGQITLPSYTVLDVRGTISHSGGTPVYADGAHAIEIPNYSVTGSPGMGMRLQRCSDVVLGNISVAGAGIGIRIDNAYETGNAVTTENVRLDFAYVEGTGSHGVETYGVDDIDIGTVQARDTGGCGLLLNDTSNATVDYVDAVRANEGGGYAGFRCANDAGPNVHVNRVRSIDCGRGVFTVSGSHGITIEEVYLEGNGGNLIQDTRNVEVNGGTVVDNGGEGFRIDSRSSNQHPHTRDVTIRNVGIYGHSYGVRETGPDTEHNAILDNDFCNNGTDVETYASSTTVSDNTYCEGEPGDDPGPADPDDIEDPDDPEPCEPSSIDPYLNVDGGDWQNTGEITIEGGSSVEFGPHPHDSGSWTWDGPGVSSSSREIVVTPTETSTYTATHTNECGETSTEEYVVHVEGGGDEDDGNEDGSQDLDGDGLYRDVDGNGEFGVNDVVTLFEDLEEPYVTDNPERFDFTGNGQVTVSDVVDLFEQL